MIEPKFIEWMNMELDGVLPARHQKELHEYLSTDAEAADYFDGLRATVSAVDSLGPEAPPADLGARIAAALPRDRYGTSVGDAGGGLAVRLGGWLGTPRWRYATVFAFGIIFGILVYSAITYGGGRGSAGLDTSNYLGTMRTITTADGFEQTQAFRVDLEQVHGNVRLHQSNRILLAEVALETGGDIEWVVQYDTDDLSFDGYRCFEGETGGVVAAAAEMRVEQSGNARYLLFFTQKDHPAASIVVKIYSADQLLLEKPLTPAAKSAE